MTGDPAFAALRKDYGNRGLDESSLAADPYAQLAAWIAEAAAAGILEPNAMVLGTADAEGRPSARTVLLKGLDARGLLFFTHYTSPKGTEIAGNPYASLVFPWYPLERQVVVTGSVERASREESAAYFSSRPHGARLGAWASQQSQVIGSRAELEGRVAELAQRWPEGEEVPLPDDWGGLRVVPSTVEFWQGRSDRLHDRLRFRLTPAGDWVVERLSP